VQLSLTHQTLVEITHELKQRPLLSHNTPFEILKTEYSKFIATF